MAHVELRPGQVVELELAKSKDEIIQFRTLVEEYAGDTEFTLLAPMYKAMPYPFGDNDVVDLIYTVHDDENVPHAFTFRAKTTGRFREGDLAYLKILRISDVEKLQRRGFYRLHYVADMFFEIIPEDDQEAPTELLPVITRDISAGGFRGIVTAQLPVGTGIRFHLDLGRETMIINARIISNQRMEDSVLRHEIRGTFFGLNSKDTGHLIQGINHLQSEYIRRMSAASLEERLASYGQEEFLFHERRRKKDWVLQWLDVSVILTWALTFIALVLFLMAMPEKPNTIDRFYGYPVRLDWDLSIVRYSIYLMLVLFVITSVSVVLNATRLKREGDHYRPTLVVMGALSLALILIYILFF